MNKFLKPLLKGTAAAAAWLYLVSLPLVANAMVGGSLDAGVDVVTEPVTHIEIAQSNGMTLSQAVDSVRRQGNVERVISARTQVSGGREVHIIKVLTKDHKVKTHRIQGRRRN